ncbi:MAG: hypothetical protein EHM13_11655 [Acidobacteria bacterium]|nr:MAG: hypothetical protein EHM13_11655 [Acidobacteriota bacterium]
MVPFLRNIPKNESLEDVLDRFHTEGIEDPHRRRQLAAVRFYIQAVIHACEGPWRSMHDDVTCYRVLIDQIRHAGNQEVSLVTFNYDRLLEAAIGLETGRQVKAIDDYLALERYSVYKVHGSVNWGRAVTNLKDTPSRLPEDQITQALIQQASELTYLDEYYLSDDPPPIVRHAEERIVLVPAVAVPLKTKDAFECPPVHLAALRTQLKRVRRVLVIGWRGFDYHFVDLLKTHLPRPFRVQIVCGGAEDAKAVLSTLMQRGLDGHYEVLGTTFSEYVISGIGKPFLSPDADDPILTGAVTPI